MLIRNLFFLFSVTLFAVASTVLDIFNYNPYQSGTGVFVNFYVSFWLGLTGIISIIIYYTKIRLSKDKPIYSFFWPSVRQATIFSAAVTLLLLLKGLKLLDLWVGIPLLIAVVLTELFFQTNTGTTKKVKKL